MNESEAKTNWCPFARVYSMAIAPSGVDESCNGSWNRHPHDGKKETRCIGSECMAWRESHGLVNESDSGGYCGLAGKP